MHVEPAITAPGLPFSKYVQMWFKCLPRDLWTIVSFSLGLVLDIIIRIADPFVLTLHKVIHPDNKESREWLVAVVALVFALFVSWISVGYKLYRDRDTQSGINENRLLRELHESEERFRKCGSELASKDPRIKLSIQGLYVLTQEQETAVFAYTPPGEPHRQTPVAKWNTVRTCVVAMRLEVVNNGGSSSIREAKLSIETPTGVVLVADKCLDTSQFRLRQYSSLHMSRGAWAPEPDETTIIRRIPKYSELKGNLRKFVEGETLALLNSNQVERGWLVFRVSGTDADVVNASVVRLTVKDALENSFAVDSRADQPRQVSGTSLVAAEDANPSEVTAADP
jgi:hypothetical protein